MRTLLLAAALAALGQQGQRPVIRSSVLYVSTEVVVRDDKAQFVSSLRKGDFDVFEDGVKQDVATFTLTHGGRIIAQEPSETVRPQAGLLLPPLRPASGDSGRVFLLFIDDAHLEAQQTPAVRDLLKRISTELIHEGDLVGIVSSGTSSIAVDLTYDRKRLDEAIKKVMGGGLTPSEIVGTPDGAQGPPEVRHRAHVAFSTVYEILQKLEEVHNRRKAFIYISNGYDFDPFAKSRAKANAERFASMTGTATDTGDVPDTNPFSKSGNEFAAADLAAELAELTREARRANTAFYTIDPRGLVAGMDIALTNIDASDWQDHIRETQSSLRVMADLTGGLAVINTNDFTKWIKRIDAETSDYYLVGYYSNNPDPLKRRRTIEIRVKGATKYQLTYKTSYTLKPK